MTNERKQLSSWIHSGSCRFLTKMQTWRMSADRRIKFELDILKCEVWWDGMQSWVWGLQKQKILFLKLKIRQVVVVFLCNGICRWQFFIQSDFFFVYLFVILKKRSIITKLIPLQLRFNVSAEWHNLEVFSSYQSYLHCTFGWSLTCFKASWSFFAMQWLICAFVNINRIQPKQKCPFIRDWDCI